MPYSNRNSTPILLCIANQHRDTFIFPIPSRGILQCDRCCTIAFTKRGIIHRLFIFALIISKIWQIDHHPTITWSIKAWNFYSIDVWKVLKNRRNVEIYFQFEFIAKNVRSFILWQTILALDTQNWRIYPFLMREA